MARKKPDEKLGKPPPKCKAILLCDQVIIDAVTRKTSLINIFDKLLVSSFPGTTKSFMVYMQFVDGIGSYGLSVEIHDLRENTILARLQETRIEFQERVNKFVVIFSVPQLPLPHGGTYDFVVFADGQEIDRQKFEATVVALGDTSNDGNEA